MRLILGGINGHYLRNITENAAGETAEVLAAVAYATEGRLLFDWCRQNNIPLKYWGRLDESVAVSTKILREFLLAKSQLYICKLVKHHHAKVIWWRGFGIYVGSANLTNSAWYNNVEAGCFFDETEIDGEMASDIDSLFKKLDEHATPLTEELLNAMLERAKEVAGSKPDAKKFWSSPSFTNWEGLSNVSRKNSVDRKKQEFLEEWHSTLQQLRNIGERVSKQENRPTWIANDVPTGAQADQFLHAHYYEQTFDGRKANYETFFEKNKNRPEEAVDQTINWWRSLPCAPGEEGEMLNERAPFLQHILSRDEINKMTGDDLQNICSRVNAIRDYARRVRNASVSLPDNGTSYTIDQKVEALAKRIRNSRSGNGSSVVEALSYVLYGGSDSELPERLWDAFTTPDWKIDGFGVSAIGEIVGWALPDKFPPRNGRTSKALRSLGFDVQVHV
jgi:hypothetical protein